MLLGPAYRDHGLVFASAAGTPIDPASLMLQQGIHAKIISERLGHSGIGITVDTYGHLARGLQAQAVAQLDQWLANG